MELEFSTVWEDYGLEELQNSLNSLFPQYQLPLQNMLERILTGDVLGIVGDLFLSCSQGIVQQVLSLKSVFVWLLLLGIAASILSHFAEVLSKHQVADLSYYFMYLLTVTVLLKCFLHVSDVAGKALENIVLFMQMVVPAFLLSVGVATGITTVGAYSQLFLLIIYGIQQILGKGVFQLISGYMVLTMLNGIWIEERLALLVEFMKKIVLFVLKAAIGIVTGVSLFQSVITPVLDCAKSGIWQKVITSIPGVGNVSDGIIGMVLGSAVVIKNSIGVVLLLLLLILCATPLVQIFAMAWMLRLVAAVLGIVSDKRLVDCTNRMGEGCMLLLRTVATAMVLFLIVVSVLAMATNRGF